MVDDGGQLYTIEGISAAMIMLLTAYFVLGATSIYTPGDTHISDMQLEQVGSDALRIMTMPVNGSQSESQLQMIVEHSDKPDSLVYQQLFNTTFSNILNNRSVAEPDHIQYSASITHNWTGEIEYQPLVASRYATGREHAVRVTKWVIVNKVDALGNIKNRAALVEVLLWSD